MKKLFILICCLVLIVISCCGCGSNAPISTGSTPSTQDQISSSLESSSVSSVSESSQSTSFSASQSSASSSVHSSSSSSVDMGTLPSWKRLYIGNAQIFSKQYHQYALIELDGDTIPELYMGGTSKNVICTMSSILENATIAQELNVNNTAYYIPKSGKLMNVYVNGDHTTMAIYQLDGSFQLIFEGHEYLALLNDGTTSYLHYIGKSSTPISEDTFKATVAQYFDTSKAVKVSHYFMSCEEVKSAITNW